MKALFRWPPTTSSPLPLFLQFDNLFNQNERENYNPKNQRETGFPKLKLKQFAEKNKTKQNF